MFVLTLCANILVSFLEDKYIFLYLLHAYEMFLVITAYSEGVNNVMKNLYIVPSKRTLNVRLQYPLYLGSQLSSNQSVTFSFEEDAFLALRGASSTCKRGMFLNIERRLLEA